MVRVGLLLMLLFCVGAAAFDEGLDDGFVPLDNGAWCEKGKPVGGAGSDRVDSMLGTVGPASFRPEGALSDIIVYCSAGHGFTADTGNSIWETQRGLLYGVVEDMGNIDQLNLFADYCFNAGATVVPMRPLGYQTNEVVLDNDDAEVSFSGSWNDSSSTVFFGDPGDVPYRYALISANGESAYARYRPTIPEAGRYPVYTWARWGSDRVKQVYRIAHAGGVSQVDVNHRRVGLGWVWLGTYWFEAGTNGYVDISNEAPGYDPANDVIIADAIRFGNGMGDVDRGFGVSGFERELECSRYWVQRSVGQGMASSIYDLSGYSDQSDNVGAPRRMAESMNREDDGDFFDRIYLGFHSNANDGSNRGALALYDTRYPVAFQALQKAYGQTLNDRMESCMEWGDSGVVFNDDWTDSSGDLYGSSYGELYGSISNEMNTTIIEVAFHDNASDCNLLKDAVARRVMAWSCYQGVVEHLHTNNASVPLVFLPEPPTAPRAENAGDGSVVVSWTASVTNGLGAGAATGYVVYVSADGRGFGDPVWVDGGSSESAVVSNLAADATWYFRIAARNEGGESFASETVGVMVRSSGTVGQLVVNGFDRCDRSLSPTRYFANNLNGDVTMVRPQQINSYDYVVEHGEALAASNAWFDSCAHGAVSSGDVGLTNYSAVFWILGEESTTDDTLDIAEQTAIESLLDGGGCLMISGAELGWDLGRGSASDQLFMTNVLRAAYVADDAGTNGVTSVAGSIFDGVSDFAFQEGEGGVYSVEYPDCLGAVNGSVSALQYGSGYHAATVYSNGCKVVVMGFPFEAIVDEDDRRAVMGRVVGFFAVDDEGGSAGSGTNEVIAFQGFEGTTADDWGVVAGGSYVSSDAGAGDTSPAGQRIRTGTYSWQRQSDVSSSVIGFELGSVSLTGHSNVCVQLWLSATDPSYSSSGMDANDYLKVFVATNGADFGGDADVTVTGYGGGVRWGYDAEGVAVTTCGVSRSFAAASDSPIVRTSDGYASVRIHVPDDVSSVRLRVDTVKQFVNEYWNVDDVTVFGMRDESDVDGDGASAYAEYVAGTDPERADSVLRGACVRSGTAGHVIEWESVTGRVYRILSTTNLQEAFSVLVSGLSATPPVNVYTDQVHTAEGVVYYRIGVEGE